MYTTVCTQGDFTWAEMRRKLSSHSAQVWLYIMGGCQSTTLCIELCAFLTHLRCISEALPCTLMHCILDSTCYATPHHPLHPCLHTCHLCLFVCLFTFVTGTHVACFVCLFPLPDWFH